jgi:hypothetical protein
LLLRKLASAAPRISLVRFVALSPAHGNARRLKSIYFGVVRRGQLCSESGLTRRRALPTLPLPDCGRSEHQERRSVVLPHWGACHASGSAGPVTLSGQLV